MVEHSMSFAVLAQLVEQGPEESRVPRPNRGDSTNARVVQWLESLPSKQTMRVRFPLRAPISGTSTALLK